MYFEIYQEKANGIIGGAASQWRWRLKSANHQIVASGESYHNKADCLHAVELVKGTDATTPVKEPDNIFSQQSGFIEALAKELQDPKK